MTPARDRVMTPAPTTWVIEYGGLRWLPKDARVHPDMLGFIPTFFTTSDPRSAREQIAERYIGSWAPLSGLSKCGFTLLPDGNLAYPGDPPTQLLVESRLREEVLRLYEHAWFTITQPDGSWEVARLD